MGLRGQVISKANYLNIQQLIIYNWFRIYTPVCILMTDPRDRQCLILYKLHHKMRSSIQWSITRKTEVQKQEISNLLAIIIIAPLSDGQNEDRGLERNAGAALQRSLLGRRVATSLGFYLYSPPCSCLSALNFPIPGAGQAAQLQFVTCAKKFSKLLEKS